MPEGGSIVNIASILGAAWPQRLEAHRELGAHPVPQDTSYQYFKEALIV